MLNRLWPPPGVGEIDDKDYFGTFGPAETESQDAVSEVDEKFAEQ